MKTEALVSLAIPLAYPLLLGLESKFAARPFETVPNWRRTGILFFLMVLMIGSLTPLLLPYSKPGFAPLMSLRDLGLWGIPVGLLVSSFVGYWLHRAEHRSDFLWRATHQLHHSALRVDLTGAFLTHPVDVALKVALGGAISLWVLGLTPMAAASVTLISALLNMWQHLNITTPHWVGYLIARPEAHVLHHERNIHARNYGDLPIWDMIFGTFVNPVTPWVGEAGFSPVASKRITDMLLMKDVNRETSGR